MGVSIHIGGFAVGGPAGVADAAARGQGMTFQFFAQIQQTALGLYGVQAALFKHRNACRVVAAVFQIGKALQQHFGCSFHACVTNNSAHMSNSP